MSSPDSSRVTTPTQSSCPFCRSTEVFTTSKAVTDETYWRCRACGQIWNPQRLSTPPRTTRW